MTWTLKYIEELKKQGKIAGYRMSTKNGREYSTKKEGKYSSKKGSKIKGWIKLNLSVWCRVEGLTLTEEHAFHPDRKWRFDFAIAELNIAIEYEGLMSDKSRHTTVKGFTGDTDKYREAAMLGWTVLRYTATNYKQILRDLEKIKKA